ncbi:MAG: Sir2 family NAD-dependent protein deacetylase [Leucobacter sp.]
MSQPQSRPSASLDALASLFAPGPIAVLTGAGISTDSGIPDYRGAGAPPRNPMSISQFMRDEAYRRRFWAGARIGYLRTANIAPNSGHLALANLEAAGRIDGVITQNVDDLHRRGGSRTVVELHGNGAVIRCVDCDHRSTRGEVLDRFDELNPNFVERNSEAEIAPDGDAVVRDADRVEVPRCAVCGGLLRPDVVYFGETVPPTVFAAAERLIEHATALLLAGTSLAVNTGVRLVHRAERRGIPIAVINRGPTSIDARESVRIRIEGGTSETLTALEEVLA